MAFIESPRFPELVSEGAVGGPEFKTSVAIAFSGHEQRNIEWDYPRQRYNAALGAKTIDLLEDVRDFFYITRGRAHGFRYWDPLDYKSCDVLDTPAFNDQAIGIGDGVTATFQLRKTYTAGANTFVRLIKKPVSGTVLVGVAGVQKTITTHFTVDTTTGIITFTPGNIPTLGQVVTAGFQFDVPCRFDTDHLEVELQTYRSGRARIPIIELRL